MSDYRELVAILKELLTNRFYPKPSYIRGLLGDGNGNVLVPGRDDFNYARFNRSSSEKFEIFNKEISQPIDGWPILIGEFPWSPGLIQVVGTDWAAYSQTGWGDNVASIQAHAPTHEWPTFAPGSDAVNVYMRALTPLRTQVVGSGSNSVYVTPYEYDHTGTNVQWPGVPAVDFSAKPPTGSMLYMGVYLNPTTNALGVVSGSTTVFTDALEPSIPNWPLGVYPSGYVRLYGGQAGITERDIRPAQRIYNTTLMFTGTSSGGSGGNVWPAADENLLDGVNFATATLLIAAMASGDIGYLGQRVSVEAVTLNQPVTLRGVGASATVFQSAFTITNDTPSRVREIRIDSSGSNARGFDVNINGSCILQDCEASCFGTVTSRALDVSTPSAGAEVTVIGGRYEGLGTLPFDIYADTDAIIHLEGPILAGGLIGGPGDVTGYYYDDAGNLYFRPGADITLVNPVNEFSTDGTLGGNSDLAVPTEQAVKTYVDASSSGSSGLNPIINGAFQLWQRGTSFAAVVSGTYTADRFGYGASGAMVHTVSRSTDVPTVAQAGILAPYSYLVDCTTVDSSIAAGDFAYIYQVIEGSNFLGLAQRVFTVSFWVKATKTGVYCLSFRNSGADRSYVAEYTISTTNTWEFKTVTVSASPTAGTWDYTTGAGLLIGWALAAGSTFQTTAGSWQTGSFLATANQVNVCDDTANDFRLALVKIEPGSMATPFVMPDYGDELNRCRRYLRVHAGVANDRVGMGQCLSTTSVQVALQFDPPMRIAPSLTATAGNFSVTTAAGGAAAVTSLSIAAASSWTGTLLPGVASGLVAGNATELYFNTTALLMIHAEF